MTKIVTFGKFNDGKKQKDMSNFLDKLTQEIQRKKSLEIAKKMTPKDKFDHDGE